MKKLYHAVVLDHPWLTLTALVLVGLAALWGTRGFELDASSDSLVVETDPALTFYREMNARYDSGEFLVLTYTPSADVALFSQQAIQHIGALRQQLRQLEGVASVRTMLGVPLVQSAPGPLSKLAENVRTLESPGVDLAAARKELTTSPLYSNLLVSEDGEHTALQINFPPDTRYNELITRRNELLSKRQEQALTDTEASTLERLEREVDVLQQQSAAQRSDNIAAVRAIADAFEARTDATLYLGGVPMIAEDMLRFVRSDLVTFGVGALVVMVAAMALFFRRVRWVALPLACSAYTTLLTTGFLGAMGWPITVISSNFVSLLLIITLSLTIHLIVRFRELLAQQPDLDHRALLEQTLTDKFAPCAWTALTTIVAFGSLVSSGIVPVVDFGWMMCMGITIALVVCFTLFPAVLMVLGRGRPSATAGSRVSVTRVLGRFTDRHVGSILAGAAALAAVAAGGVSLLTVENSFVDYFGKDTEIYQGMTFIDEHLGGTMPFEVLVSFPPSNAGSGQSPGADPFADPFASPAGGGSGDASRYWYTPAKIALIDKIHDWLAAQPETGKVLSLATLSEIAQSFNNGQPLNAAELALVIGAIPQNYKEDLLAPYANPETGEARISVRMLETNRDLNRDAFLERVCTTLTQEIGLEPSRVKLTGLMVLYNNMLQTLFTSQLTTVAYVAGGILLTFIALFRSLTLGLLALLPNALAAASVLGLMGFLGIPLDVMTITIAAIVIGIGVDNTIHYVHRFRQELPVRTSYRAAIHASHNSIGHAMYYTSLIVIAGFSVMVLSNFKPTIYFGSMTAASMALAVLANLTLLPALLVTFRPLGPPGTATRTESSAA